MQQRVRIPASQVGKRFDTGRFGLPRLLAALLVLAAMAMGLVGTGRGAQCARRNTVATGAAYLHAASAPHLQRATPDGQVPAEGGVPAGSQACPVVIALPVSAMVPIAAAPAEASLPGRPAALVALDEPQALFRPPRA